MLNKQYKIVITNERTSLLRRPSSTLKPHAVSSKPLRKSEFKAVQNSGDVVEFKFKSKLST